MPGANTVVASEAEVLQAFELPAPRLLPILALAGVAALGFCGLWHGTALPRGLLAAVLVAGALGSIRAWLRFRQRRQRASARRYYEIEQRIIGLAFVHDGVLSTQLVSETLRLAPREASELLSQLVISGRARAHIREDTGETAYDFSEAKPTRGGLRVRQVYQSS